MTSKRKKSASGRRTVYTTRQIMDLTEERRLKQEALSNEAQPKPVVEHKDPEILSEQARFDGDPIDLKSKIENVPAENTVPKEIKAGNSISVLPIAPVPVNAIREALVFILSLVVFFLVVSSKFAEPWVGFVTAKINVLIIQGSLIILNNIQGACFAKGETLSTVFYKLSLRGDWVAFSSLELLIIFAALFIFFQKSNWKKRALVFISMIPLAIIANIFRVVVTFGVALNCGTTLADQYFHEILVACVFIFIIIGLILLEFLYFTDEI